MPFILKPRRQPLLDRTLAPTEVGDLCFLHYKPMVEEFRANRRWTTAHNIYKSITGKMESTEDSQVAKELAWQVFFQLHVMPYELEKQKENGDI